MAAADCYCRNLPQQARTNSLRLCEQAASARPGEGLTKERGRIAAPNNMVKLPAISLRPEGRDQVSRADGNPVSSLRHTREEILGARMQLSQSLLQHKKEKAEKKRSCSNVAHRRH